MSKLVGTLYLGFSSGPSPALFIPPAYLGAVVQQKSSLYIVVYPSRGSQDPGLPRKGGILSSPHPCALHWVPGRYGVPPRPIALTYGHRTYGHLTYGHLKALGLPSSSGRLDPAEKIEDAHPKLWCALSEGKVVVFDASSWTIHQHCFKVGASKVVSALPSTQGDAE